MRFSIPASWQSVWALPKGLSWEDLDWSPAPEYLNPSSTGAPAPGSVADTAAGSEGGPAHAAVPLLARRRRTRGRSAVSPLPPPVPLNGIANFAAALKLQPDPIQTSFLEAAENRLILCCTRQWGKSSIAAVKALYTCLTRPGTHILIASLTLRQSLRLLVRIRRFAWMAGYDPVYDRSEDPALHFPNGSVVRAIPNHAAGERSLDSVHIVIFDEAAFTPDELFYALYGMTATTTGALWLLSTPNERKGFFYEAWHDHNPVQPWRRFHVPATHCPRISGEFLELARAQNPDHIFRREYMAEFVESTSGLFTPEAITAVAEAPPIEEPVALSGKKPYFGGLDVGQRHDHTALALIRRLVLTSRTERDKVTYQWKTYEVFEVTHLLRFELHLSWERMCETIAREIEILREPRPVALAVDSSGSGLHLSSMVADAASKHARTYPVTITSGQAPSYSRYGHNLPRRDLLNRLATALESGTVVFASHISPVIRRELQAELRALRADFSCAPGKHDDLAIALSLALWLATKR